MGCHEILENYDFCKEKFEAFLKEPPPRKPILSGKDLIQLGFKPGPLFKKILNEIETEFLEGALQTQEDALKFVKHKFLSSMTQHTNQKKEK